MKIRLFSSFLILLYIAGFAALIYLAAEGWQYYHLPLSERPHTPGHTDLRPGGLIGHGLGILGSTMIMLLFLYSARKRGKLGLRFGRMGRWLDVHIWFGIMGPLFITLHTAGKFNGLVSISYWSMVAVMLSGFVGRYIYLKIPRDERGHALSIAELDNTIEGLATMLREDFDVTPEVIQTLSTRASGTVDSSSGGLMQVISLITYDLTRPLRNWRLKRFIRRLYPTIPGYATVAIFDAAKEKASLTRRRAALRIVNSVFHYWHVLHKPFAVVMVVIMFVHIAVVTLMGYKWIF